VLRYDLRKHRIGVSVILPGAVDTGLVQTVVINADADACERGRKLFSRHAITPERVAGMIIDAIERNRFMVITSMDIKLLYFLKRTLPPAYDLVLRVMTWLVDKVLTRDSLPHRL
jgi:short-subunit dehydrogenase